MYLYTKIEEREIIELLGNILYDVISALNLTAEEVRDLTKEELERLERYYSLIGKAKRLQIEDMQEYQPFE